ncbi:MAG: HlyD family efflux transporter periplasmic adaptor subunit [Saprospiraceae bacterium]|nr:HlyD family efflux transporter periplasmic adaptor subunit [Saprospiraceae bacterium]
MKSILSTLSTLIFIIAVSSCNKKENEYDASGIFEADEVIVSSEVNGRLISFSVTEGTILQKDSLIAQVDAIVYQLQEEQIDASIQAIGKKNIPVYAQIEILQSQIKSQQEQVNTLRVQLNTINNEKARIEKLVSGDAVPGKHLDDIKAQSDLIVQQIKSVESQIGVTQQQIKSQSILLKSQNSGINSEKLPLEKRKAMAVDQLNKTKIRNPVQGTVLTKYVNAGEMITIAKPLYKIADLSTVSLKAYVTGAQLSKIKLQQDVEVFTDFGENETKEYNGKIIWISDKSEFTPKTVQTKDERANLVYAIKIMVKNDGYIKLGMYGEVKF